MCLFQNYTQALFIRRRYDQFETKTKKVFKNVTKMWKMRKSHFSKTHCTRTMGTSRKSLWNKNQFVWIWTIFLNALQTPYTFLAPPPIKILKENLWKSTNQTRHSFCFIGFFCKKLLYMDFNICTFMSKIYMYMPYACILDLLDV